MNFSSFFSFLLISTAAVAAPSPDQIFQSEKLTHWTKDWNDSHKAKQCNDIYKNHARKVAEEAAVADCEASGFMLCLVRNSVVTFNGQLDAAIGSKYGVSVGGIGYSEYGCEARATIYGYR